MLSVQTMDTTVLPRADRFAMWQELVSRNTAPAKIFSDHAANFVARATVVNLGPVQLTAFRYPALSMDRGPRLIRRSDPELYQLALPLTGRSSISQSRQETPIAVSQFTLIDTSRPQRAVHLPGRDGASSAASVTLQMSHADLSLPERKVGRLLATPLPADSGMGRLLAQLITQVIEHPEQFRAADAWQLGVTARDLLAAVVAARLDVEDLLPRTVQRAALRTTVLAFIEENLHDPGLNPAMIAAAHHISVRTLHRLFADGELSLTETIRRRRLARCERDLTNPLMRHQPIQRIAVRCGFTDMSWFRRSFRAEYGMLPQEWRRRAAGGDSGQVGAAAPRACRCRPPLSGPGRRD